MATVIRLRRMGAKKNPLYRIVAVDSRKKRDGAYIEAVGHYDPRKETEKITVQEDRIQYWVSVGATLSNTVKNLLRNEGVSLQPKPADA